MEISKQAFEAMARLQANPIKLEIVEAFAKEFVEKHHNPDCTYNHPRLLFAFWQSDFKGGKKPYWHVMNKSKSQYSTLSIEGARQWEVIQ